MKVRLNQAREDGGGIEIEAGDLSLVDSTVSGNRTLEQDGGGMEINDAVMRGTGNAIFGNAAGDNGGGIENDTGSVTLVNTTISDNTALGAGSGPHRACTQSAHGSERRLAGPWAPREAAGPARRRAWRGNASCLSSSPRPITAACTATILGKQPMRRGGE